MSQKAITWAIDHSSQKKTNLLVLLALAHAADYAGYIVLPNITTLARKARLSDSRCSRALKELVAAGEIETWKNATGTESCRILMKEE